MKQFHQKGTLWTRINNIIETPLFVESQLTSMIQIADVCAYALRRYLENGEEELFDMSSKGRIEKTGSLSVSGTLPVRTALAGFVAVIGRLRNEATFRRAFAGGFG